MNRRLWHHGFSAPSRHAVGGRRPEREDAQREQIFRAVFDYGWDATLFFNDEELIIDANPAAFELLQVPPDSIIGQSLSYFLTPSSDALSAPELLRRDDNSQRGKGRVRRADGSVVNVQYSVFEDIAPGLHLTVWSGVSSHARAEALLKFLAEASALLADHLDINGAISRVTERAVPTVADWAAVDVLEDNNDVISRVALSHVDPSRVELAKELWRRSPATRNDSSGIGAVIRTGKVELSNEISSAVLTQFINEPSLTEIVQKLGPQCSLCVPVSAHGRNIGAVTFASAESGRHFGQCEVALAQDLAHRIAMAMETARLYKSEHAARQQAELASKARDDFIATLSHELRTPLNSILGWASLLQTGQVTPRQRERAIEVIKRNAMSQAKLIEDLLDVSRIASGKMRLTLRSVKVAQLIALVRDTLKPTSDAKMITIDTVMDAETDEIIGDPVRLQQLVSNLLNNAIKFTPEGGHIDLRLEQSDHELTFRISDNGYGVSPELLPTIFERFRQGEMGSKSAERGLGLGLAISRHIVELHGGHIKAQSAGRDRGTTFTVTLPKLISTAPPDHEGPESSRMWQFAERLDLRDVKILIVDDEKDSTDMALAILAGRGAIVDTAATADEAFEKFRASTPDIIVSDIGLPGMDGYDLLRNIRNLDAAEGRKTLAIALTAHARSEDRQKSLAAGYAMHLPKPIEPLDLISAVNELMKNRR